MRWPLLALLALSGLAFASPTANLPRGTDDFLLGWSPIQVDSALAARGAETLSSGPDFITAAGESPEVEYVEYSFAPLPHGLSMLWRVTVAYRVPYDRDGFRAVRDQLTDRLGPAAEEHRSDPENGDRADWLTWVDTRTSVRLGARWSEPQDPHADRMITTWTDRRLQKVIEAQQKKRGSGRK